MDEAQLVALHQRTVSAFVLRARRVEAHSIARDRDQLLRWARHEFQVGQDEGGQVYIGFTVPPEEQLESALARARPLILVDDPTYYGRLFKSLNFFTRAAPQQAREASEELRRGWVNMTSREPIVQGFQMQVANLKTGERAALSDTELAWAWVYGDTVHATEDQLVSTRLFGVAGRYEAAVPIVCRILVQTLATLGLLRVLHAAGVVPLSDEVLTLDVVVTTTEFRKPGRVYSAPIGTKIPGSLSEPFSDEWTEYLPGAPKGDVDQT